MQRDLAQQRNLIVRILIGTGVLCVVGLWTFESATGLLSDYDSFGYPLLLAAFAVSLLILLATPRHHHRAERLSYFGFALYCICSTQFFDTLADETRIYTIANTLQWMSLLYVTAFVLFRKWEAIGAAAAVFMVSALSLWLLYMRGHLDHWDIAYNSLLVNAYVVHLLILVSLSLLVFTQHAFDRMRNETKVLEDAALTDPLTGVVNRRGLERLLKEHAAAPGRPMALILLDMDNFKGVNDTQGHLFGDQVLRTIVDRLRHGLRGADVIGRWGGDEFLVLAANASADEACMLADRLRRSASDLPESAAGGVTLSAGVMIWDGTGGPEEALRCVDDALYAAKQGGRDRTALGRPRGRPVRSVT